MSEYPKELWLVCGKDGLAFICEGQADAATTAYWLDVDIRRHLAPHLIARVTPEWKKPEEQK